MRAPSKVARLRVVRRVPRIRLMTTAGAAATATRMILVLGLREDIAPVEEPADVGALPSDQAPANNGTRATMLQVTTKSRRWICSKTQSRYADGQSDHDQAAENRYRSNDLSRAGYRHHIAYPMVPKVTMHHMASGMVPSVVGWTRARRDA